MIQLLEFGSFTCYDSSWKLDICCLLPIIHDRRALKSIRVSYFWNPSYLGFVLHGLLLVLGT